MAPPVNNPALAEMKPYDWGGNAERIQAATTAIQDKAAAYRPPALSEYMGRAPNQPAQLAALTDPHAYMQERGGLSGSYVDPTSASQFQNTMAGGNRGLSANDFAQIAASSRNDTAALAQRRGLSGFRPGGSAGNYAQGVMRALYEAQAQEQSQNAAQRALGQFAQYQLRGSQMDAQRQASLVQSFAQEQGRRESFNENARRFGFQAAIKMHEADLANYQNWARNYLYDPSEEILNTLSPGSSARAGERRLGEMGTGYNPAIGRGY